MGYIDIHSHILPALDDGAQSMEQSMEMLRLAAAEGITHMFATPHYKAGRFKADPKAIAEAMQQLRAAALAQGIDISLYPGTEIYYRSGLEEKFEKQKIYTMNHSSFVLLEFSPFENYSYIRNAMDDIFSMGYTPILAHVERYQCFMKDIEKVRELKNMGCGIQVNAGSIAGDYGFTAKRFTGKLLKQQLVDYLGTDAHNAEKRKPAMKKCADIIYKKCDREYAEALLYGNAARDFLDTI